MIQRSFGRLLSFPIYDAAMHAAQTKIEAWRLDYNQRRPHSSLGHLTTNEFVAQRQVSYTLKNQPTTSWKPGFLT